MGRGLLAWVAGGWLREGCAVRVRMEEERVAWEGSMRAAPGRGG